MKQPPAVENSESEGTGLPLFRTWRSVYFFVIGCFIFFVALLAIFSRAFS